MFQIIMSDGMSKDGLEVLSTNCRKLEIVRVIKRRMHLTSMNMPPAIPESIGVKAIDPKALGGTPLNCGNRVIATFN